MSNKLSFAKSDKIKILPVDEKGWEKVDLATPMGLIKVGGEYKAKRFTAGTEYIGILASKYIPFQEIYIVPISVGTVYTVRVEGDCNVGDTLAPVEDGYFQVGAGNLKVVKKINAEIVEAVGISTGQGGGGGQPYTLPIASNIRLGGVKVGDNLKIDQDGKLSAIQQGGGGGNVDGATVNGQAVPLQNKTLEINIDKNTVGLNHVDNTADIDKPISTATQDALDLKADTTAINKEIQDRTDADTTLQNNINTEAQTREQKDNEINAKVDALNKIVVYAKDLEVKQNWIVLHAGKVYIAKEDITLSTWDVDEPKLILTDSDTISCVSYKENIKIEKGQLVIYQQALYLCDTTIDTTTTWDADKDKMISQQATVDLNDYYNKTEMTQLLNAKQDSLTAGAGINITQNTIKIDDTIYTKNEVNTKIDQEIQDRTDADTTLQANFDSKIGDLDTLQTTTKDNIVDSLNELFNTRVETNPVGIMIVNYLFPFGSIYFSLDKDFNPNDAWTGTTWEKIASGKYIRATEDANQVGADVEAGIPNIKFGFDGASNCTRFINLTGIAKSSGTNTIDVGGASSTAQAGIRVSASDASPVYKDDAMTVTPESIDAFIWKRIG